MLAFGLFHERILISCDDKDYFVAVGGKWYDGEDHNAVAVFTGCSPYEVPENDKIYMVPCSQTPMGSVPMA